MPALLEKHNVVSREIILFVLAIAVAVEDKSCVPDQFLYAYLYLPAFLAQTLTTCNTRSRQDEKI